MGKPMKLYLSGPMTGRPNHNREAFYEAEEKLRDCGYDVVNPARAEFGPDADWITYMRAAMRQIADVDAELLDQIGQNHITRGWLDELHEIWDRAAAEGIVSDNEWIHPLTIHQRVIAALGRTKRGKELFVKSGVGGYAGTIRGPVGHYHRTEVAPTPRTDGRQWRVVEAVYPLTSEEVPDDDS